MRHSGRRRRSEAPAALAQTRVRRPGLDLEGRCSDSSIAVLGTTGACRERGTVS
jgi:hypothetical protein